MQWRSSGTCGCPRYPSNPCHTTYYEYSAFRVAVSLFTAVHALCCVLNASSTGANRSRGYVDQVCCGRCSYGAWLVLVLSLQPHILEGLEQGLGKLGNTVTNSPKQYTHAIVYPFRQATAAKRLSPQTTPNPKRDKSRHLLALSSKTPVRATKTRAVAICQAGDSKLKR